MTMQRSRGSPWVLALGVAAAGLFIGCGLWQLAGALYRAKATDRFVTVKGLAEREVAADLVIWPITFTAVGDAAAELQGRLDADAAKVRTFLTAQGFAAEELTNSIPRVNDLESHGYRPEGATHRYTGESTVTLRTDKVAEVRAAMQRSAELVKQGVVMIRSYEYAPQYVFTQLNAIKPDMIAEATRNAREAAEQFARDSGSTVGNIRTARQGFFSVEDRDRYSPEWKQIRVVTTVEYLLDAD